MLLGTINMHLLNRNDKHKERNAFGNDNMCRLFQLVYHCSTVLLKIEPNKKGSKNTSS